MNSKNLKSNHSGLPTYRLASWTHHIITSNSCEYHIIYKQQNRVRCSDTWIHLASFLSRLKSGLCQVSELAWCLSIISATKDHCYSSCFWYILVGINLLQEIHMGWVEHRRLQHQSLSTLLGYVTYILQASSLNRTAALNDQRTWPIRDVVSLQLRESWGDALQAQEKRQCDAKPAAFSHLSLFSSSFR